MQGTITRYFADRAFGFIKPDGSRTDAGLTATKDASGIYHAA